MLKKKKQYVGVIESREENTEPTRCEVCVIFKDAEEEQKFSKICKEINYGLRKVKKVPTSYRRGIR